MGGEEKSYSKRAISVEMGKRNPFCILLVGRQIGETVGSFLNKLKIETLYVVECHSWVFIWCKKNTNLKAYMHPHVQCSIIYDNQEMETA